MYVTDHELRLVGKAWEIRRQLRKLAAESEERPVMFPKPAVRRKRPVR